MKTKSIIFALILVSMLTKAQTQSTPNGYLALNTGLSIPTGSYKTNYALPGYTTNLSFALHIKTKGWGISSLIGVGTNGFDINSFIKSFAKNSAYSYTAKSASGYNNTTLLIGGLYTIPKNKISFDFIMQGGLLLSNYPGISVALTDNYGNISGSSLQTCNATSFGFNVGAGVRYSITPKIALCANSNWLSGTASYTNILVTNYTQDQYGNQTINKEYANFHQHISLVSLTIGIAWQFDND